MAIETAIISPVESLVFSERGDIYMCLSWLCTNVDYKRFFERKAEAGEFVILDNGVNEGRQTPADELVDLAVEIRASEVVLPDTIRDREDTDRKLEECIRDGHVDRLHRHGIRTQAVVQGRTILTALDHFFALLRRVDDGSVDTIGLGYDCYDSLDYPDKTASGTLARLFLTQAIGEEIRRRRIPAERLPPIHLLGLYNPLELAYQKQYDWIRSNDSSSPVLCGVHGIAFDPAFGIREKPARHLDFLGRVPEDAVALIGENITQLHRWAH